MNSWYNAPRFVPPEAFFDELVVVDVPLLREGYGEGPGRGIHLLEDMELRPGMRNSSDIIKSNSAVTKYQIID